MQRGGIESVRNAEHLPIQLSLHSWNCWLVGTSPPPPHTHTHTMRQCSSRSRDYSNSLSIQRGAGARRVNRQSLKHVPPLHKSCRHL